VSSESIRWGVLSTGNIARVFSKAIVASQTGRLCAVASRSGDAASRFPTEGLPQDFLVFATYEAMLAADDIVGLEHLMDAGLRQLRADEQREQAAGEEEEDGRDEVLDADHLVVGVDAEVVAPAVRAVARVVLRAGRVAERVVRPVVEGTDSAEEADRGGDERRDEDERLRQDERVPAAAPAREDDEPEANAGEEQRHPGGAHEAGAEQKTPGTAAGRGRRKPAPDSPAAGAPRTGAKRTVIYYMRQLPQYMRLLGGLLSDRRVSMVDKLLVAGALAYIVMPIDLIPDFIPFFGEVDDVYILVLALQRLISNAGRDVLLEHWSGDVADLGDMNLRGVLAAAAFFLPKRIRRRLKVIGRA